MESLLKPGTHISINDQVSQWAGQRGIIEAWVDGPRIALADHTEVFQLYRVRLDSGHVIEINPQSAEHEKAE
jgi:hypothetical protein